jgi:hypothetical protein
MSDMSKTINWMKAKNMLIDMMNDCINEMVAIGIPVQANRIHGISLMKLNGTQAGCYFKKASDGELVFLIAIHELFANHLDDEVVIANVKNSIYHELLHTCPNAQEHNDTWLDLAVKCDNELGTTTRRFLEKGFFYNTTKKTPVIYRCTHCGYEYYGTKNLGDNVTCDVCGDTLTLA